VYSVLSVIDKRLPSNTKKLTIARSSCWQQCDLSWSHPGLPFSKIADPPCSRLWSGRFFFFAPIRTRDFWVVLSFPHNTRRGQLFCSQPSSQWTRKKRRGEHRQSATHARFNKRQQNPLGWFRFIPETVLTARSSCTATRSRIWRKMLSRVMLAGRSWDLLDIAILPCLLTSSFLVFPTLFYLSPQHVSENCV